MNGHNPMNITQAILPVAGLGTRFLTTTKVVPKELFPLGSEPIIAKLVDECLSVGIQDICFVISPGKELIPQYFNEDPRLEAELEKRGQSAFLAKLKAYNRVNFHTVYQHEPLGDGHAILQAANWVQSEHVAILFGDDLIVHERSGLQQLTWALANVPEGEQFDASMVCLQNVPRECTGKYGIVQLLHEDGRMKKINTLVEKPKPSEAPSTLGVVGKYIIPGAAFRALKHIKNQGREIRLIDALIQLRSEGKPVYGWEAEGIRLDTGTPEGYKEAVKLLG